MPIITSDKILFRNNWFAASKHVKESEFYIQMCNEKNTDGGEAHKQRLWSQWENNCDIEFYFFEISVPDIRKNPLIHD